jgi:hypothetical protein
LRQFEIKIRLKSIKNSEIFTLLWCCSLIPGTATTLIGQGPIRASQWWQNGDMVAQFLSEQANGGPLFLVMGKW